MMTVPTPKALPMSVLDALPAADTARAAALLQPLLVKATPGHQIVVLDDDPTGVQTVHDISVYTNWSEQAILDGFHEPNSMFFVLTNSRSFSADKTAAEHAVMAERILAAAKETGKVPLIISRSDSTLRGHYPLETETIRATLDKHGMELDGEVVYPFFREGGRFTLHGLSLIHI